MYVRECVRAWVATERLKTQKLEGGGRREKKKSCRVSGIGVAAVVLMVVVVVRVKGSGWVKVIQEEVFFFF